jgi:hypothetical protein
MKLAYRRLSLLALVTFTLACGSASEDGSQVGSGTGGFSGVGGNSANVSTTGTTVSTGGTSIATSPSTTATGGTTQAFQKTSIGGAVAVGATTHTGGTTPSDSSALGGTTASTSANPAGGKATGGMTAKGGATATGGKSAGGASAVGGATPQGGTSVTGGVTGTSSFPIADGIPTVYLAGDSTVQTYATNAAGQQGWGQRLQEFFTSDVVVVNKSIGGRSSKSFIDEGRLKDILTVIKKGDYLFAQWGINDRYTSDTARYTNPATTFRTYLKQYIDGARAKNAIPVLVTPTPRHQYVNGVFENGFADVSV